MHVVVTNFSEEPRQVVWILVSPSNHTNYCAGAGQDDDPVEVPCIEVAVGSWRRGGYVCAGIDRPG